MPKASCNNKKEKKSMLTMWEWETLVASWRYFEHGHTISSASFPADIIHRYWGSGNKATDEDRMKIAHQFIALDHRNGPDDKISGWPLEGASFGWIDAKPWRRLWFFLNAVHNNDFHDVHGVGNGADEWLTCFKCEGKWVERERFIQNPDHAGYMVDEYVKEVR